MIRLDDEKQIFIATGMRKWWSYCQLDEWSRRRKKVRLTRLLYIYDKMEQRMRERRGLGK